MEPSTEKNSRPNPLVGPLVAVSLLSAAAVGTAGVLWANHGHQNTATPDATAKEPATAPAKAAPSSGFDAVAQHLDKNGSFYLYLDTAQWLSGLGKQIDMFRQIMLMAPSSSQDQASRESMNTGITMVNDLVTKSGLEEISDVGASSISVEPKIYLNKLFIRHSGDKADGFMWSAFGKTPHHLDILDFMPMDTALATSSDLDLANVLAGLREEIGKSGVPNATLSFDTFLAQFSTNFGVQLDDLLKSLDGSMGLILTLNPAKAITLPVDKNGPPTSFPTPRLAILLHVKDDRIFGLIDKALTGNPAVQKKDTAELRTRVMPIPGPMETWLRPTVAQWSGGYLLIASDDSLVNDMLEAQQKGRGLRKMPEFVKLLEGLPEKGNGVQVTTPLLGDTVRAFQRQAMKNQPTMTPDQAALMEKIFGQSAAPGTMCSISTHLPDGWLIASKGNSSMNSLLGPAMIAPAALAAAIAVPAFMSARERSQETKSLSNEKQIVTACLLYAADHHGQFPPDLMALVPKYLQDKAVFISPFNTFGPAGYDYQAGHADTDPANTILLEDRFSATKHLRVVAHVDGSAEVIRLPKTAAP
ncbi:hypothetical protein CfE428DRAFT_5359 [Chthoniobacter flavus Ellin428]|uniref:DUF3352 domain-containing protein n=1 Tax=Chthoniobacter flavus Ellin428 TaxID=497964 RepID=B4D8W9_9BACT|nr:hypothetical protein [Chthoniobacter flavus]EDY17177.1 hypothetical protein CfE428DRAFT_5359 [Chthoniobacter flavus Ellin428]TCO90164.1 hypothetical protein EV701_11190 [Chthoniobacter flavus]